VTGVQLAVVDELDLAGLPTHAVAAVEGWAQTLASLSTRRAYRAAVRALLREHGEITPATVADRRDEQTARGLGRATIRQRIAAVRAFSAWAARTGALPAEVAVALTGVQAPRLGGQHAPIALHELQLRLMDRAAGAAWADDALRAAQARAVLRVLGGCWLRVSELAGAQLADLVPARPTAADRAALEGRDVDGWSLHVRGKGGRRRTVPVPVPASVRKAVLGLHRLTVAPAPALVPGLTVHRPARVADPPRAIAVRTAQQVVARLAAVANELAGAEAIPARLAHPHALRHGFALRYLAGDGTLGRLQQLLGHEDIATTARYLAAVDEQRAPAPKDPWAR
jgi:integrase/recombinase XerC